MNEFKKLKHLGTFQLWSKDLKPEVCVQMLHHINPSLTFDEQFSVPNNRQEKLTFTAKSFQVEMDSVVEVFYERILSDIDEDMPYLF